MAYDALGRQTTQSNGIATSTFAYNPSNLQLNTETIAYNLDGQPGADFTRVIDRSQDNLGRDTGWTLGAPTPSSAIDNQVEYQYSATDGRLATVRRGDIPVPQEFDYTYTQNSSLIATVTSPVHTVSNVYELDRNVLASKVNKKLDTTTVSSYFYTVNNYGQRTGVTTGGTAFSGTPSWAWGYNSKGEVVKADSSEAGLDRAYAYDGVGNRTSGGDQGSPISYTANALNQYSAIGSINPSYDDDGNATAYALPANLTANSTLIWDAENRLIEAQVTSGNTVNYVYDSHSRRIAETVGSATTVYIYDGWNPIAEYNTTYVLTKTYTWGLDLSGTSQGAGGVGGLLSVNVSSEPSAPSFFPTYDGNGNVSEYLDTNGTTVAHYEYDPFGKTTVATGSKAADFSHRFSTKPLDVNTGLYYYGYRYYDPETGRWPSRDPIGERGGVNLYSFVRNDGVNHSDLLGNLIYKKLNNCIIGVYGGHGLQLPSPTTVPSEEGLESLEVPVNIECAPCSAATLIACSSKQICDINNVIPGAAQPDYNVPVINAAFPDDSFCPLFASAVEAAKKHAKTICNKTPSCCTKVAILAEMMGRAKGMCKSTVGEEGSRSWIWDCESESFVGENQ